VQADVRATGEGGYTLVEVLVAIVILGFAFVASMGGLATSITVTDYHRQESQLETVLGSAAENVKSVPFEADCSAAAGSYRGAAEAAATAAGWSPSRVTLVSIRTWDWATGVYENNCTDTPEALTRLQLVTFKVDHPAGRVSDTLSVSKSG
jgi:prepilin-type N-terminal cleavage/methylation domain-containing protein